jgi:purine nucleosidase/pyrimidine-specific ribonucleoside hydrolase
VAGISGVPIAAGADRPLAQDLTPADWIHGANALGGPELPDPTSAPLDSRDALDLIRDIVVASEEKVTLVPTGPLTNIARFIQQHPDLLPRIDRVVWMGGSTTRGNVTAYAEFNAWTDPEAIKVVLDSGVDFTMVGLNISHQALITREVRDRIRAIPTRTGSFGADLLEFFCSTYEVAEGMPDGPLHDPITIALLADPEVATVIRTRVDAEVTGTETRGATCVDLHNMLKRPQNARVAMDLDVDRFWTLIADAVAALD